MKQFFFLFFAFFLIPDAFSQYFNTTQISMLMGHRQMRQIPQHYYYYSEPRDQMMVSPSVTMTHSYMISEHFAAGVGIGFELFDYKHFPLFADLRYTVRASGVSPFFGFKFGHAFSSFKKKHYDNLRINFEPYYANNVYLMNYGGLMVHPEMGAKIPLSEESFLVFTVAYRHQKSKSTVSEDFGIRRKWKHNTNMNRLAFGVAIMFM